RAAISTRSTGSSRPRSSCTTGGVASPASRRWSTRSGSRMPMSSTRDGEAWLIAGGAAALVRFEPALEAHRTQREVRLVELPAPGQGEWWRGRLDGVTAAVLVADPHVAPRDAVPATHLPDTHGRRVPVGVVPD